MSKTVALQLADPDCGCKPTMCAQRAVIDGLVFARRSQVDCASLPLP
ncbi:MAG: hypothetical protein JNK88_07150 [Mangrovicoccus sp.]|nr:hypothetical protein [Mangrovicoccus sp.]